MALSDLQLANLGLVGAVTAAVASSMTNAQDCANALFEQEITYVKAADDANATATTPELVLQRMPRRAQIVDAYFTQNNATALVAVAANYAQVTFQSRDGAGGSALSLGLTNSTPVANGGTGNFAGQWKSTPLTVTPFDPTNAVIPAGGMLTLSVAKQGAGVILPAGTFTVRVRYI